MIQKPETRYINKIHRQIIKLNPETLHTRMSMMPGSANGIADMLYESTKGTLWVEYKYIPTWIGKRVLPMNKISPLQLNFLSKRIELHRPCAVIIGAEDGKGCILFNEHILNPPSLSKVLYTLNTPTEVALWIHKQIT